MVTLEQYNYKNITYDIAEKLAVIRADAFKNDVIVQEFLPEAGLFDEAHLPPLVNYEKLIAKVKMFKRLVASGARQEYIDVLSDPRVQLFMLKDDEGQYVAGAHWILPKYLPLPKIGIFHRLRTWVLKHWYSIRNIFTFIGAPALDMSQFWGEFKWGEKELSVVDSAERQEELHSLNLKELKETAYPKDDCYYLLLLCVLSTAHGKGYGKRILHDSLKELGPYHRKPGFIGPAKASLMSAPSARGFYIASGFSLAGAAMHEAPSGQFIPHNYFFINIHTVD